MSNVVMLKPVRKQEIQDVHARLIAGVAQDRRTSDDVFWLKENAELLGVLVGTGTRPDATALAPFEEFYAGIAQRLQFFPQYYRFLLSLCLDLEDLGLPGDQGTKLTQWVARSGLVDAELSDLQRGEARRLLARRGAARQEDPDLDARLERFIGRPATFAVPNKKAAYELTHIVFYLSEYGQHDPELAPEAIRSLRFAGLLAYLDQNVDLLAEVCTALRFARAGVPPIWEAAVTKAHRAIMLDQSGQAGLNDAFHEYLVTGWMVHVAGGVAFGAELPDAPLRFHRPVAAQGALRTMSECMFEMGENRSGSWQQMRPHVLSMLGSNGHEVLVQAERSSDEFEAFFEGFARAGQM